MGGNTFILCFFLFKLFFSSIISSIYKYSFIIIALLINGATSTLIDIVVEPNLIGMPMFVMVNFDNYISPRINNSLPITQFECKFKFGVDRNRI